MKKERSTDVIERKLIQSIMEGGYQTGHPLQSERELALTFGVGRPTVREVLQRLNRDGWITIRTGMPAVVNDYWKEGNLSTIVNIVRHLEDVPDTFVTYLLELRITLLPAYIKDAITYEQAKSVALLSRLEELTDDAATYAAFDWHIQKEFARLSPNPMYALILNSFDTFYLHMAQKYFIEQTYRLMSRTYYETLLHYSLQGDALGAAKLVKETMEKSLLLWQKEEKSHEKSI